MTPHTGPNTEPAVHPRGAALRAVGAVATVVGMLVVCAVMVMRPGPGGDIAYACGRTDPICQPTVAVTATTTVGGSDGPPAQTYCYRPNGDRVACTSGDMHYYAPFDCYLMATPADQWPPAGDPIYNGADPSTGQVYWCSGDWTGVNRQVFIPGQQPVDPRELVEQAAKALPLEHAQAKIAPGPEFHTYINIDNWLWVPQNQWHPTDVTVSAGPISVTAVAEPVEVVWDMGTEQITCPDAGRPWVKGMTDAANTTCSYAYSTLEDPEGDVHQVSARIAYDVTWTCTGLCLSQAGDLGRFLAPVGQTTTIDVRQRQTVVTQ